MSPTLCLNMIVKNESKIIERLLRSVVDIIDCYCICDTGSDDNTIEVIKTFFEKHNKPGKIVQKPFINFCVNRNYAAEQAYDMADYLLFLDADMILNVAINFSKDSLTGPFYSVKQYKNNDFFYYNNRIASTKYNPKYYGVTHEYLSTGNQKTKMLNTIKIHDISDGGCKEDKFARDILLLTEGLKNEPTNARYMFYLANSYRDISQPDKAIECYKKRIKIGGWDQEIFNSMYNIGLCYKRLGNINEFVCSMIEAWNYRPIRVEPLFRIIQYYVDTEQYQIAMVFYDKAKTIAVPNDTLFIEGSLYGHKLDYLYTRIAYYCKITEHVYKKFETLFKCPNYNQEHLLSNYTYYVPIIKTKQNIDIENITLTKKDTYTDDIEKSKLYPTRIKNTQDTERNWCLIPDTNDIIYKWFPLTVCKITETKELVTTLERTMPYLLFSAKGSSTGFRYKDELWFVVHYESTPKEQSKNYLTGVIVLDADYKCMWYSFPFKFCTTSIEYCLDIKVDEQTIFFTHSESHITHVEKESFILDYKITP